MIASNPAASACPRHVRERTGPARALRPETRRENRRAVPRPQDFGTGRRRECACRGTPMLHLPGRNPAQRRNRKTNRSCREFKCRRGPAQCMLFRVHTTGRHWPLTSQRNFMRALRLHETHVHQVRVDWIRTRVLRRAHRRADTTPHGPRWRRANIDSRRGIQDMPRGQYRLALLA